MSELKPCPVKYDESNEIERLRRLGLKYENLIKNGLICGMCGGCGSVGNPPDDYYDCPECVASYNKIKADAVHDAGFEYFHAGYCAGFNSLDSDYACIHEAFRDHKNELERGEQ